MYLEKHPQSYPHQAVLCADICVEKIQRVDISVEKIQTEENRNRGVFSNNLL